MIKIAQEFFDRRETKIYSRIFGEQITPVFEVQLKISFIVAF